MNAPTDISNSIPIVTDTTDIEYTIPAEFSNEAEDEATSISSIDDDDSGSDASDGSDDGSDDSDEEIDDKWAINELEEEKAYEQLYQEPVESIQFHTIEVDTSLSVIHTTTETIILDKPTATEEHNGMNDYRFFTYSDIIKHIQKAKQSIKQKCRVLHMFKYEIDVDPEDMAEDDIEDIVNDTEIQPIHVVEDLKWNPCIPLFAPLNSVYVIIQHVPQDTNTKSSQFRHTRKLRHYVTPKTNSGKRKRTRRMM